jgi:hypothetical protein
MPQRERRASPRRRKQLKVLVSDPADALNEPYAGWLVDRSQGGICLTFCRSEVELGNILMVQPASASGTLPWVEVQVKNRRPKNARVELGCQFAQHRGWERILLLE